MLVIVVVELLALSAGTLCWTGGAGKGLSFQPGNQPTDESDASLFLNSTLTSISDFSMCMWFKVFHFKETTSYLVSYATSDRNSNEMNFGVKTSQVTMVVRGYYFYEKKKTVKYLPDVWYHVCFVANNGTDALYINGKRLLKITRRPQSTMLLNGSLVLGQETDLVNGGYQSQQSYSGLITGFNMYSRSLNKSEVEAMASCEVVQEGDLVGWSTAKWKLAGDVTGVGVNQEDYCTTESFRFTVIPKRRLYTVAHDLCSKLKTTITLPKNSKENTALYDAAVDLVESCQPPNHATVFFWLGTFNKNSSGIWTDNEGARVNYTNFEVTTTKRTCAGFKRPPYYEKWAGVSCFSTYEFCVSCQEVEPTVLKMRGLCEQELQSTYFRLEQQLGEVPSFRGFTKYQISFDGNNTWSLINMWTSEVVATHFTYESDLPFGRKMWFTATNFQLCEKPAGEKHMLSLSACYDWEYTCGEGSCINLSQRCDLRVDCPDHTDETGCDKLSKPKDYLHALPPPGVQHGPLFLNASVSLQDFSQMNIQDMKLTVDFSIIITWFDLRLHYQNLKALADFNFIEPSSVWTPTLELVNAEFPKIHKSPPVLTVNRQSLPEEDQAWRLAHDEVYKGSKNSLRLSQKFNAPFSCTMNLRNFPFDQQHCHLLLRLASARSDYLQWRNMMVDYLGEALLTEYEVGEFSIEGQTVREYSVAVVNITFLRRYGYYVTSAYLPTIMLMLISYASLFCKRENRDLRVMMSLTTLLVLNALHQQISESLPKTSYIKAIDVWCFFALTFIFSQVIYHVAIDVNMKWPHCLRKSPRTKVENIGTLKGGRCCNPLLAARIFYFFLFFVFCLVYWYLVITTECHGSGCSSTRPLPSQKKSTHDLGIHQLKRYPHYRSEYI